MKKLLVLALVATILTTGVLASTNQTETGENDFYTEIDVSDITSEIPEWIRGLVPRQNIHVNFEGNYSNETEQVLPDDKQMGVTVDGKLETVETMKKAEGKPTLEVFMDKEAFEVLMNSSSTQEDVLDEIRSDSITYKPHGLFNTISVMIAESFLGI